MTMRSLMGAAAAVMALALAGCGDGGAGGNGTVAVSPAAPVAAVKPPAGGDWTQTVVKTPDGGFRMGNPDAPVKLVEYGALSCSHCAAFAKEGLPELQARFIAPGKVSYEFRNFMLNVLDVPAALLTRCRGAEPYFQLSGQMFDNQKLLFDNAGKITPAGEAKINAMGETQKFGELARQLGLVQFFRVRGVPEAAGLKCLSDPAALDELTKMSARATGEYNLQGTPTFLINGKVVPDTAAWPALKPALTAAVGG